MMRFFQFTETNKPERLQLVQSQGIITSTFINDFVHLHAVIKICFTVSELPAEILTIPARTKAKSWDSGAKEKSKNSS